MKSMIITAAAILATVGLSSSPANAEGCVKGAVIGGVAGHFAAHHGLLGAGAGCLIGRHEANRPASRTSPLRHRGRRQCHRQILRCHRR